MFVFVGFRELTVSVCQGVTLGNLVCEAVSLAPYFFFLIVCVRFSLIVPPFLFVSRKGGKCFFHS